MDFEKKSAKDMWITKINGDPVVIKATQETMEKLYKENKISTDYSAMKYYKVKE